eukprot:4880229-Pleurochrysis_carterae.AAC.1
MSDMSYGFEYDNLDSIMHQYRSGPFNEVLICKQVSRNSHTVRQEMDQPVQDYDAGRSRVQLWIIRTPNVNLTTTMWQCKC